MEKWEIRSQKNDYRNRIFTLRNLDCMHNKKKVQNDFYIIDTFNWINVVALTSDGKFILVKQHRLGTDEISIETPGGVIDEGENPEDCAVRELREETGYTGKSVHLLKSLWVNPAIMSNRISFYLIDGCELSSSQELDEAEDIEVITVTVDELSEMIRNGEFSHSIAVTGLGLYFLSRHNRFGQVTF
jgi:8-oxo-dGTP pyrophosphatase MutT (NUDIX family)